MDINVVNKLFDMPLEALIDYAQKHVSLDSAELIYVLVARLQREQVISS